MIPVTKPYLPEIDGYKKYIDSIYNRQWLTNNGPLVNEFELKLKENLAIKHLLYVANGTLALQLAIKALGLSGEVITTPFSYVATTSSLVWEGCSPIFVDIDQDTLNIDVDKIEESITDKTTGIVATHCFGNACNIEKIETIAKKYNIKVIFDAAHCYGTSYKDISIFSYGDISITSFHATKLMHSVEGGALFTQDPNILENLAYLRNFGHDGPSKFKGVGINAKNSEFHAAMGLCVLKDLSAILQTRKNQSLYYDEILKNLNVTKPIIENDCNFNFAYYPIIFENEEKAVSAKNALEQKQIYPRRYFHPSLTELNYVTKRPTPVSDKIASSILCLPLYHSLSREEQDMIARILLRNQNYGK